MDSGSALSTITGVLALLAFALIFTALYRLWLLPRLQITREKLVRRKFEHVRETTGVMQSIMTGLESPDAALRMSTLATLQPLTGTQHAGAIAALLMTFIRSRLDLGGARGNTDDVLFALSILLSRRMRSRARAEEFAINLSGVCFDGLIMRGARFHGLDLSQAQFNGADLAGADFCGANLHGAALKQARLQRAILDGATLNQADLSDANLTGASLKGANLELARLAGAILARVRLNYASLQGADLFDADLAQASVWRTNFADSDISGALLGEVRHLTQKQLDVVVGDANTTVPERFYFVPSSTRRHRPALEVVASRGRQP